VLSGNVVAEATTNCYLRSEAGLVAAVGSRTSSSSPPTTRSWWAPRNRTQEVKTLVTRLLAERRDEADALSTVHRPWGTYRALHHGHRVQVKHIMVKPGAKLSLQMHHHRAEHWVVVQGTAKIVRGNEELVLTEDQSTYIPLGTQHRLENPGKIPLQRHRGAIRQLSRRRRHRPLRGPLRPGVDDILKWHCCTSL